MGPGTPDARRTSKSHRKTSGSGTRSSLANRRSRGTRPPLIVLDASAVLELLLNTVPGQRVADRIARPDVTLHAPHLLGVEVAQAMRRYVHTGIVSAERGRLALTHFSELDLRRYPHEPLMPRMWVLSENLTAYDAAYVTLAEALAAPLLTLDRALASVPGSTARVEVLEAV